MDFQQADVARREAGIAADLDVIAARRRVGDDTIGQPHAHSRRLPEVAPQPGGQQLHHFRRRQRRLLGAGLARCAEVVQGAAHGAAEVRQVGIAGVEAVGAAAVEALGDGAELRRAAVDQQVDDLAVLLAHAHEDLPGGVAAPQAPPHVALQIQELQALPVGIEGQRPAAVVVGIDRGQCTGAGREEGALDVVGPLDGVEDADGPLGLDQPVAQAADEGLVGGQGAEVGAVGGLRTSPAAGRRWFREGSP